MRARIILIGLAENLDEKDFFAKLLPQRFSFYRYLFRPPCKLEELLFKVNVHLLDQSYDEKCSITIKDGYMTLLPKRSGLTKIYGQQISDFNLADSQRCEWMNRWPFTNQLSRGGKRSAKMGQRRH